MSLYEHRTVKSVLKGIWTHTLSDIAMFTFPYQVTVAVHKLRGVKVGKKSHIGRNCLLDDHNPEMIEIGERVGITYGVKIICHKRDMSKYKYGMNPQQCPFIYGKVKIEDDVHIGIGSTIMPGVTIGKGAVIGACSLVTKDVPPYSLAVGSPAKIVKTWTKEDAE